MLAFWKKRDKELADIKRKKEKFDKELKKRQQEEEEALLQRKRLEYLMKQSEIYAHFMANKMGMNEELKEQKRDVLAEELKNNYKRVEVDEANARKRMAKMINEDKRRLRHFDQEV
jgi:DNA helicase INO80